MMTVFPITYFVKDYCSHGEVYFVSVYKDIGRIPALIAKSRNFLNKRLCFRHPLPLYYLQLSWSFY